MLKRSGLFVVLFILLFSLSVAFVNAKTGTCVNPSGGNYCNAKSQASECYCDAACTAYGDCCDDYNPVCAPSPVLSCGNGICEVNEEKTCPQDCIKKVTVACTDSDGGLDYYVKGFMKAGSDDSGQWDTCYSDYDLVEYYCNNNLASKTSYNCPDGCQDGACMQSSGVAVDKVETDKELYGLNEKVSISATATSSAGFPDTLTAEVQNPNYQGTKVTMTPSACSLAKTDSNVPVTCIYKGIFANTTYEGYYNVNVATGDFNSNAYTSFSVLDKEKAGKYLIMNDVGIYKLANAWHFLDNSQGTDTYGAYYSTDKLINQVAVYVFSSRDNLFIFLNKALEQVNYYTQTIDGNLVYVVSDGGSQVFAWTKENLLIVSYPEQSYSVQYGGGSAVKAVSKNAEPSSKKTTSTTGIFGNVVASQTEIEVPPTTTTPIYDEVVLAYLGKHPSDLDKEPPIKKITKQEVINWINANCQVPVAQPNTPQPLPVPSVAVNSVTGNVVSKIFTSKSYWKD